MSVRFTQYIYTVSPPPKKKTCDYIFYNNCNNRCPITIIFGIVIRHSIVSYRMNMLTGFGTVFP